MDRGGQAGQAFFAVWGAGVAGEFGVDPAFEVVDVDARIAGPDHDALVGSRGGWGPTSTAADLRWPIPLAADSRGLIPWAAACRRLIPPTAAFCRPMPV